MIAIIQARSTSTRLPNKGLLELDGKPIIQHVYAAVKRAIEKVVVAVPFGDPLSEWCFKNDVLCFQGPEDDCLTRYYKCAKTYRAKFIVRITADCPLLDTAQLFYMAHLMQTLDLDFITNAPCQDGTDIEIMSYRFLSWLNDTVKDCSKREHVTLFAKENMDLVIKNQFKTARYRNPYLLEWLPKTSLDTPEDMEVITIIYNQLKKQNNEGTEK